MPKGIVQRQKYPAVPVQSGHDPQTGNLRPQQDSEHHPLIAGGHLFPALPGKNSLFIGKAALEQARPISRRRVGLKITGRGIAREECPVYDGEKQIGVVTSGTHCPWLGQAVAMAMVDVAYKEPGTVVQVDVRGRKVEAEVVKTPFYKRA